MDIYILDSLWRRNQIVQKFISMIWTERFAAYGDFELEVESTIENRSQFKVGTRLGINLSYRVMTVETVEDGVDDNGNTILNLKGRSLEAILDSRLARGSLADTTTEPKWTLNGTPVEIATQIFHDICVEGILHPSDIIPNIHEGSIFTEDTIPPPADVIEYDIDPSTVYAAETTLCNQYLLGFRLVKDLDTSNLYFDVYTGSDRTSHQTLLPAVIFSPSLGNLQNTTELTSIAAYKTVAYVLSPVGSEIVYAPNVLQSATGFDRQVLVVNADDITDTDPDVATAQMIQKGLDELAKNRQTSAFDGEINEDSQYQYGRDYNLGDLVQLQNSDGVMNDMQVTEQIFASDDQGDRSYPTLTVTTFITPGSWLDQPPDKVWEDFGATEYWVDQP